MTRQPFSANNWTVALPIPPAAPVMRIVFDIELFFPWCDFNRQRSSRACDKNSFYFGHFLSSFFFWAVSL
jgi:hypothetical protein